MTAEEFGHPEIQKQAKMSLRDAAMVNTTRWALYERLKETGVLIECGTGARTKKQREEHGLPKTHYYDACCVGASTPAVLEFATDYLAVWTVIGRGTRRMCNPDRYGFPRGHRAKRKKYFGFQTGDLVRAIVPKGKYAGIWTGRVAVRANGSFDIKDSSGKRICQSISYKYCRLIQRNDGWQYTEFRRKGKLAKAELFSTAVKTL